LETKFESKGKQELLDIVRSIKAAGVECFYVRQAEALGLDHAVLCAERMIGDEQFAVILADDLTNADDPVMNQMVAQSLKRQDFLREN
jgi:UTP--glucose-1-phosphate uridylyltransferase